MLSKTDLENFDKCLKDYCEPLYSKLLPSLRLNEVEEFFRKWQIEDENLMMLFQWKNGILYDDSYPTSAFDYTGFGVIPSLEYIAEIKKVSINKQWRKSYFPLVLSFGGDFLLYETDKSSTNYGMIFLHSPNLGYVDYQPGYFDSIQSMIITICDSFKEKVFKYGYANMDLDINFEKYGEIAKRLNPKSEYWNDW